MSENGTLKASYVYDDLGQLVRENNKDANKTWVYTYDDRGNIISKKTYSYTTGTLGTVQSTDSYSYYQQGETAMWGDGLKSYKGSTTFTYDAIGNPLTYNNGSAYTFTWQNGRQLASGTVNGVTSNYTYNSDGLRTRKVVGNKVYDYYWFGSQLAMMTITEGSNVITMKFYYDEIGTPIMLDYNGTLYYYITNLQGDVVGIADNYGVGATYRYDAWGNIIASDSASNVLNNAMTNNPLRYRGYIYDAETGFYYLQSRYYDPVMCRFINADGYVSTGTGLLGYNMYAYCNNNPVNRIDPTGMSWEAWWEAYNQAIQQNSGYFAFAAALSQTDSPALGPMDVVTAVLVIGGFLYFALSVDVENTLTVNLPSVNLPNLPNNSTLEGIANSYEIGECVEAANAMKLANGGKGNIINLYFPNAYRGYVCCDRYPNFAISENGNHYGYLYNGVVRCNIYPEGLPQEQWISSFYDASGTMPIIKIY